MGPYISIELDIMLWGNSNSKNKKHKKKPATIDLRKRQSFFDTLRKKKTHQQDDILKCKVCKKAISGKPIFCNQYLSRTRLCNAGPFCSDDCWQKHLDETSHY